MKIAVCVSGETRDFNKILTDPEHRSLVDFVDLLQQYFPTVDVYGHTWAHCELPDVLNIFKSFSVDDQAVIDEWVKEDFLNRAFPVWINKPTDVDSLVPDYLARSRKAYGQVFSGFRSFGLVPVNHYDVIIRYRWDLGFENNLVYFEKTLVEKIKTLAAQDNTSGTGISDILIESSKHQPRTVMQDAFFMLNTRGHDYITAQSIEDKLADIFRKYPENEKTETHNLWFDCIFIPPKFKRADSVHRGIQFDMSILANFFQIIKKDYTLGI